MTTHRTEPALRLAGVTKTFGSGERAVHALQGIDVLVHGGELVAVRGRSGSGKTTMLHVVGGLESADDGVVEVAGQDVRAMGEDDRLRLRREHVAYVYQSFGLVPELTAAENVSLPLRIRGVDPRERDRLVTEVLARVGLGPHARQTPRQLSGGQQQRVSLARALVARPAVLLADEPTGQLDSETAREIMALVVSLVHEGGMAALLTTHDPMILGYADRTLELVDGRLHPVAQAEVAAGARPRPPAGG